MGVTSWCLHRKGPLFVSMFHPLGIVIATVFDIIFLGDILYLGRYAPKLQAISSVFTMKNDMYTLGDMFWYLIRLLCVIIIW